jgi:hypothetical protein
MYLAEFKVCSALLSTTLLKSFGRTSCVTSSEDPTIITSYTTESTSLHRFVYT